MYRSVVVWCKQKFPALAVLAIGSLVLAAAIALPPGANGWGEGGRWHLPPCTFKVLTGLLLSRELPCPTCGFTHAFSYAAHGQVADAFKEQPAGALLFFAMLGYMASAAWKLVHDSKTPPRLTPRRRPWMLIIGVTGAIMLAAWAYKIWVTVAG